MLLCQALRHEQPQQEVSENLLEQDKTTLNQILHDDNSLNSLTLEGNLCRTVIQNSAESIHDARGMRKPVTFIRNFKLY